MKIKSLILAMAACAGLFSACTNDLEEATSGKQDSEKNAAASFSFIMPNAAAGRAADNPTGGPDGDGSVDGTSEENQFENVKILLFKEDGSLAQVENLVRANFSPTIVGGAVRYTTKKDIKVAPATYKIYVVLSPTPNLSVTVGTTTLEVFQGMVEAVAQGTGLYCTDNRFMMTNANEIVTTTVAPTNIEGNAKAITINVERLAAKVTFSSKNDNNTYDVSNTEGRKIGSVTFDAYKIINTRNSAYNLRRVGMDANTTTIGGAETGENYVIENQWGIKSTWDETAFNKNYSRKYNTYVAFRKLNQKADLQTLAYCLENTMPANAQLNGYSTGVIFRAKIALDAIPSESGDLYKYDGKYYATLVDLAKGVDPKWDGTESLEGLSKDVLGIKKGVKTGKTPTEYLASINNPTTLHNDFSVDYFVGGYCYYSYWLRHANNNNSEVMGIMEFAIVRNNVYRLTINSVTAIGDFTSGTPGEDPKNPDEPDVPEGGNPEIPGEKVPDPEPTDPVVPIDPITPDENNQAYLNVSIDVLPWIIRENDIDF